MSTNGSPPTPPDYSALAQQTAASNAAATQTQTVANRPNQTDAQGNTSTWKQDPTTGQWTQNVAYSGANQSLADSQNALKGNLMDQASTAMGSPINAGGMTPLTGYDTSKLQTVNDPNAMGAGLFSMDPTGNSKSIQDATYALTAPQRAQTREAEIQRMKNQGLTEDSAAFQNGMRRLDAGDTDAQMKALLAGTTEYGNQFSRAAGENAQNFGQKTQAQSLAQALRGQQFGEQGSAAALSGTQRNQQLQEALALRNAPLSNLATLAGQSPTPQFGQFMGAGNPGGTDYSQAGQNSYNASLGGFNANAAGNANTIGGLGGLLGGILGAPSGSSGNDLANWFTNLFSGGG